MFGTDPAKMLRKARRLLDGGDALAALRLARKAQARARPPLSGEAAALAEEARRAVIAEAEARAGRSEADGHLADAAEWLRGALDYAEGEGERGRIQARLGELEERLEAVEDPLAPPGGWTPGEDEDEREQPESAGGAQVLERALSSLAGRVPEVAPPGVARAADGSAVDAEDAESAEATLFEIYVDSLRDDVAALYRDRAPELSDVLVDLAEPAGAERAAAAVEEMAAASPGDPVLRLERARWRLARDETAAAREDLEVAWEAFGDEPLDLGGNLSIPVMWCEAAIAEGDHAAVLERLEERGELTLSHPDLTGFYGTALLAAGERDEAQSFLAESLEQFPRRPEIAHLLAGIHLADGDAPAVIALLERSLRVCGAGCSPRELHVPSLRLLATALAERGGPVERLADVMLLLRGAQGGDLREPGDWMLQARCHELAGETAAAERARARAGAMLEVAAAAEAAAGTAPPAPAPPATDPPKTEPSERPPAAAPETKTESRPKPEPA